VIFQHSIETELIDALQDSHFTEQGKSKNEQVASEGNDDHLLRHQRRTHDWVGTWGPNSYSKVLLGGANQAVRTSKEEEITSAAPAHRVLALKQFWANKCSPVLKHPLYSLYVTPSLLPFPQSGKCIERNYFQSVNEVK
jgi:hypothetical protein